MLNVYNLSDLDPQRIGELCTRNADPNNHIRSSVEEIIREVREKGDAALISYNEKFDGVRTDRIFLDREELDVIASGAGEEEKQAILVAYNNIRKFHETQLLKEDKVETTTGVVCWREMRPIEKVGLYVPGGSAVLPSTFLMLGIPARLAGCAEIVVCSPPQKDGKVNPYIAYCAQLLGIDRIYLCGGAQAIAAMAYGTASITKVHKIFGPGNQYVTKAKSIIQAESQTAIDMPAGPSEVLVIADETADPEFVAADLLAQAEHGADSQAILLSTDESLIGKVAAEVAKQANSLPRKDIALKAIANSYAVYCESLEAAMKFSNTYAPEHLILSTDKWEALTDQVVNAGSVFLGNLTPESAGDYASGTNHTLPTSSFAKAYSGVSVDSFVKKITFQHISRVGIENLGPVVETLASLEGLDAHKNAVSVRLAKS